MLTPVNMIMNCAFSHCGFIETPRNRGNQCTIPARIANTAPIDRT